MWLKRMSEVVNFCGLLRTEICKIKNNCHILNTAVRPSTTGRFNFLAKKEKLCFSKKPLPGGGSGSGGGDIIGVVTSGF